jgi:hypothetical protein
MLRQWQFDVLFFVGVGGAIVLLFGSKLGLDIGSNPTAVTGVGAILTFVLTQRKHLTKNGEKREKVDDATR